jgi:hypothetical protein
MGEKKLGFPHNSENKNKNRQIHKKGYDCTK